MAGYATACSPWADATGGKRDDAAGQESVR
jgi:hypothetical protein